MNAVVDARLAATPLSLPTERDEVAADWQISSSFKTGDVQMLAIKSSNSIGEASAGPSCATTLALDHPELPGLARRATSFGYHLALDTSLRNQPENTAELPRAATTLLAHLKTVGAYFSHGRRCIGLAEDTAWHEAVHEMVHLEFDARGLNPSVRSSSSSSGSSGQHDDSSPLRTHWLAYRARGYSALVAEELVAREHELRSLTASGAPLWRWAIRALCVADSALVVAQNDLTATPAAQRTHAHAAEVERVSRLRSFVTGPRPRLAYAMLPLLGLTMLASSAVRRWQGGPEVAGGEAEAPALGGNWRRRTHKERWKEQQ